jgi:predicted small secreted protein
MLCRAMADDVGMKMRRRQVACIALSVLVLTGCNGGSGDGDDETAGPLEAVTTTEATEVEKPATPEALRLLKDGNLFDEPNGKVVKRVGHSTEFGSRTIYSVIEQKDDWVAVLTPFTENGEPLWLELDPDRLKAGSSVWNIEVDLSEFETRVFENGKLVKSFPVSIGMPTAPTPTGTFAITDTFRGGLNAAYGCCALATTARQVNLPSGWLGGDRIAFHGTTGPLGAEVSHGCIRAADEDVSDMVDMIPPGTPVEVRQ